MCVIIYTPKETNISKDELKAAWRRNDDGASITYIKDGKIHVKKGYMDFNEFYSDCSEIIFDDSLERVMHFRLTSMGVPVPSQTHPYPLSNNIRDLSKIDYCTTKPVAMMNGTLNIIPKSHLNDTMTYILDELYVYTYNIPHLLDILNEEYQRWAIVTTEKIHITNNFREDEGIYYSNFHHRDSYYWN